MTHGEMSIRATIVATFINELFIDGADSTAISTLRDGFKNDASASLARNMVNNIIHYFECSDNPIEELRALKLGWMTSQSTHCCIWMKNKHHF